MTQSSFSSLAILYCHKEAAENSDLPAVANELVLKQVTKKSVFGRSSSNNFT